jgi:hypothetical protein
MKIVWGEERVGNQFDQKNGNINFFCKIPKTKTNIICEAADGAISYELSENERPDSVGLFHETLHWFHFLRHTERYYNEIRANETVKLNEKRQIEGLQFNLGALFFGKSNAIDLENSKRYW